MYSMPFLCAAVTVDTAVKYITVTPLAVLQKLQ